MKVKQFREPMLHADVLVMTSCSPKEREDYLSKKGYPISRDHGSYGAICSQFERTDHKTEKKFVQYFVWVENPAGFYALIHECLHLTKRIFTDRGILFNETNDEMMAYYQDYWFKLIWRFMNNKEKKK